MKKAMQLKPWKFAQLTVSRSPSFSMRHAGLTMCSFKGHLRQLAWEYLDETKIWSQQSQHALQTVHDKVCR